MGVSKVTYAAKVLIDLTSDTVSAATLKRGVTAHDAAGNMITGMMGEIMFKTGDYIASPDDMSSVAGGYLEVADGHSVLQDGYIELIQ